MNGYGSNGIDPNLLSALAMRTPQALPSATQLMDQYYTAQFSQTPQQPQLMSDTQIAQAVRGIRPQDDDRRRMGAALTGIGRAVDVLGSSFDQGLQGFMVPGRSVAPTRPNVNPGLTNLEALLRSIYSRGM